MQQLCNPNSALTLIAVISSRHSHIALCRGCIAAARLRLLFLLSSIQADGVFVCACTLHAACCSCGCCGTP